MHVLINTLGLSPSITRARDKEGDPEVRRRQGGAVTEGAATARCEEEGREQMAAREKQMIKEDE